MKNEKKKNQKKKRKVREKISKQRTATVLKREGKKRT